MPRFKKTSRKKSRKALKTKYEKELEKLNDPNLTLNSSALNESFGCLSGFSSPCVSPCPFQKNEKVSEDVFVSFIDKGLKKNSDRKTNSNLSLNSLVLNHTPAYLSDFSSPCASPLLVPPPPSISDDTSEEAELKRNDNQLGSNLPLDTSLVYYSEMSPRCSTPLPVLVSPIDKVISKEALSSTIADELKKDNENQSVLNSSMNSLCINETRPNAPPAPALSSNQVNLEIGTIDLCLRIPGLFDILIPVKAPASTKNNEYLNKIFNQFKDKYWCKLNVRARSYKCLICEERFQKLPSIQTHLATHMGFSIAHCNKCSKRFFNMNTANRHFKICQNKA